MSDSISPDDPVMQILNLVASVPSIIGTLIMIYHTSTTLTSKISTKLIFALAISDLVYSVANLLAIFKLTKGSVGCDVEAILREFSSKFSIWIVSAIALLHYQVLKMSPKFNKMRFLIISILGGLPFCLASALSPIYIGNGLTFDKVGIMCIIKTTNDDFAVRLVAYLAFRVLLQSSAFMITVVCYIKTMRTIENVQKSLFLREQISTKRLLWYPVTILLIYLPSQCYYFLNFCLQMPSSTFWEGATLLITHSLGLVNALLYGYQRRVYRGLKKSSNMSIEFKGNNNMPDWDSMKVESETREFST